MQWLFFEQYSHEPYIAVVRFWALFSARTAARGSRSRSAARAAMPRSTRSSGTSARREFLVAERFTIADIALYAYTHVAHEAGFEMSRYPAIAAWLERVAAQPGHVAITE